MKLWLATWISLLLPALAWAAPAATLHRGVNLTGWFRYPSSNDPTVLGRYLSDQALADLRSAGFDFVRLAVDPSLVVPTGAQAALIGAIKRVERQGLAVVISPQPARWHLETSAADRQSLLDFWRSLGAALRPLNAALTVPEVLNEPVFANDPAGWAALQVAALATIRRSLPRVTVVLTGQDWGSIGGLLSLMPEPDPNVLYSFHFYDPADLTSLAAYRGDVDHAALAQLPFPVNGPCVLPTIAGPTRDLFAYYCALGWNGSQVRNSIDRASAWARAHNVRLIAGEFGATVALNTPARLNWIMAVRTALDADHIPWALWGYDDVMGFNIARPPEPRPRLDSALLSALGLHTAM